MVSKKRKKKGKDSIGSQSSAGLEALPLFPDHRESAPMPKDKRPDEALFDVSEADHDAKNSLGRSDYHAKISDAEPSTDTANGQAGPEACPDVERTALDNPPWKNADPRIKAPFSTGFPQEIDLKINWLRDNRPKMSKQKIVQEAVRIYVDAQIAKYYPSKDDDEDDDE